MYGTIVFPPANNSFAKAPPRAPGMGRYSTSKSNKQHISLTLRQKGELSYSYTIMGFDGRAAGRTELSSRNLTGPNINAYSSAPGSVPKSLTPPTSAKHGRQPRTKVPVAKRTRGYKIL